MMTRNYLLVAMLAASALCIGCAASPEVEARRQAIDDEIDVILSEPLDEATYGKTERCLTSSDYRRFEALDDRRLLFEGRHGERWINTLRARCPDLRYGRVLVVRSYSSMARICELDTFTAEDWFTWPWYRRWPWSWGTTWGTGMTCTLGKFQPVTEAQVKAIEETLQSR